MMHLGENSYLSINLTNRCNLACSYCFKNGETPFAASDFDLGELTFLLREAERLGFSWVALTGGEPLMYPFLKEAFDLISKLKLDLFFETNAILMNQEWISFLKSLSLGRRLIVSISLDSDRATQHDHYRGEGSFVGVLAAIRLLKAEGLHVAVNKVFSQVDFANGFNVERFVGFCKGLGVDSVNFTRLVPMGRAKDSVEVLTKEQTGELRHELMTRDDFEHYVFSPDFYTARTMCDCLRLASESPGLAVYPGRVQPCAQFPEINMGTARQLEMIVKTDAQRKVNALRKATLLGVSEDTVWSCPECRPAFSILLQQGRTD